MNIDMPIEGFYRCPQIGRMNTVSGRGISPFSQRWVCLIYHEKMLDKLGNGE